MSKPTIQPLRVVVVDDNRDFTDSIATLLKLKGHEVHVAYGAQDGLALTERVLPHIVFLDIGFEGMSGYDVARRLRADRRFDQTLLVAVTGLDNPLATIASSEAGFDQHVTKPISYRCMLELLASAATRGRLGNHPRPAAETQPRATTI